MNQERLWTKDFVSVSVINFLIYFIFFSLMSTIASYAIDQFNVTLSIAGLGASIFILGAVAGRLGTGRVIEDIGNKRVLMIGGVSLFLTTALYFTAINLPLLVMIRLLNGIAYGVASTAAGTIVAKIIPAGRRGEGISFFSISVMLATALGPFTGMLLIRYFDFKILFLVTSIISFVSFALSFAIKDPVKAPVRQQTVAAAKRFQLSDIIEYKSVKVSTIAFILGFIYSGILIFMSLYSKQIHLEKAAGFFFPVFAVTTLISRPFSGRLLDARGANLVVYPCILLFALGMFLLSRTVNGVFLLAAGVLIGLGYGNLISCFQAIAIKAVPPARLGVATATYFTFLDSGIGVGPYLLGLLTPFTGFRGLYLLMSVLILSNIFLYYFFHRTRK